MARRKKGRNGRENRQPHKAPNPATVKQPISSPNQPPAAGQKPEGAPRQSLAQRRAADALGRIEEMKAEKEKDPKKGDYGKYTSYVSALPAMILMSGLGQAMAMLRSKKLPGYPKLYTHMQGWLCGGRPYSGDDLITAIVDGSEADYIRAQAEALAYLEWLKKFAVALLEDAEPEKEASDASPS